LADALGLPTSALVSAIERNRQAFKKPFYSIPDLAKRWNCSRATVYNILRESEFKLLNLSRKDKKKGKWNVPASVVERLEQKRMEHMEPESTQESIAA
jgi:predicted DNA-binding protein YlxM (UPF0122 family)